MTFEGMRIEMNVPVKVVLSTLVKVVLSTLVGAREWFQVQEMFCQFVLGVIWPVFFAGVFASVSRG